MSVDAVFVALVAGEDRDWVQNERGSCLLRTDHRPSEVSVGWEPFDKADSDCW